MFTTERWSSLLSAVSPHERKQVRTQWTKYWFSYEVWRWQPLLSSVLHKGFCSFFSNCALLLRYVFAIAKVMKKQPQLHRPQWQINRHQQQEMSGRRWKRAHHSRRTQQHLQTTAMERNRKVVTEYTERHLLFIRIISKTCKFSFQVGGGSSLCLRV